MQDKMTRSTVVGNRPGSPSRPGQPRDHRTKSACVPEVKVTKKDGRIASVLIVCTCGEQVLIECDYEE